MTTGNKLRAGLAWLVAGVIVGAAGAGGLGWLREAHDPARARGVEDAGDTGPDMQGMDMQGMDMSGMGMPGGASGPESAGAGVRMSPDQVRQFGITFASVEERPLESEVRAVGIVGVDETRVVDVTTKFAGFVERLHADFIGVSVRAGAPLMEVYAPDLVAAQEELLVARTLGSTVGDVPLPGLPSVDVDLEAAARLRLRSWDIDDPQIEASLELGRPSRTLSLSAPISGVVLEKSVVAGGAFQPGQTLFRLADLSVVWIEIEVRETDAGRVRLGSRVDVTLPAFPGEVHRGVVDFVHPMADGVTRSLKARVNVPNRAGRLRPGMYATARVRTPEGRALSVPREAVVWTGERTLIFVEDEPGSIRPVDVEVGPTIGAFVVVRDGVVAGQRVVSSAQYLIEAEGDIAAIMRSMMGMVRAGDMRGMDMSSMGMSGTDMSGMDMTRTASPPDSAVAAPGRGRE